MNPFKRTSPVLPPAQPFAATPPAPDVVDQLGDAVLVVGADGRIARANRAAGRLLGRAADALAGTPLRSLIARQDRDRLDELEAHTGQWGGAGAGTDGEPRRYEIRLAGAAGDRIVAVTSAPLCSAPNESDRTAGAPEAQASVLVLRDVTDERLATEEILRSETRYRHLFEGTSDAIMTFDAMGRFTTVNSAGEALSGYSRDELIGHFFGPLLAVESLPRAIMEFRRALSGHTGQFETIVTRKDGQRRYMTVNYACPERSREVLCVIRDATQEKQLQQQLIESEKMAAIGQLVSGVAHELNNPLASISAFSQLLLADRALTPEQRHSAEVITAEARRAARIVHNLLTFARQHKAEKVWADLNRVLEDTLELRAYELKVRGITLVRDLDDTPPETMVDVFQLQQVLLNLVTNAEQAMAEVQRPDHRLTVRSRTLPGVIRLEVEDTGPGIPPDLLPRIFNPFFTTKPTGKGTGLGLAISLGIVSEHHGRIRAENVAGGCRFVVELPRVERTDAAAAADGAGPGAGGGEATHAQAMRGLRILIADDEAPIRSALEQFLTRGRHHVVTVSSGSEALWRAEGEETFDVILLDIRMPDMSGQQIFERWRQERPDLAERVVFLTGDIVSADLQKFLAGTGRRYLAKPFEFGEVVECLDGVKG